MNKEFKNSPENNSGKGFDQDVNFGESSFNRPNQPAFTHLANDHYTDLSKDTNNTQSNQVNSFDLPNKDLDSTNIKPDLEFSANRNSYSANNNYLNQGNVKKDNRLTSEKEGVKTSTTVKSSNYKISTATILSLFTMSLLSGLLAGTVAYLYMPKLLESDKPKNIQDTITELRKVEVVEEDSETINVAKESLNSVVSIIGSRSYNNNTVGLNDLVTSDGDTKVLSQEVSAGSGFVISEDGYIISNRHVIEDKNLKYSVIFNDGSEVNAEVLDYDQYLDVGFLKIDPTKLPTPPKALKLGDSSAIQIGQTAIAIGNSLGEFRNTVSKGIISGLDRSITASDANGLNAETLDNIIQTDASINTGNSGGPLLDIKGNVIGVNVAKAQNGESIGFSIPVNSIKGILDSVIRTGKIIRPYLGVAYIDITPEISKNQNLDVKNGAWIFSRGNINPVTPGSPADKAGVQNGDIIIKVNGKNITEKYSLRNAISEIPVGKIAELTILRDGKEITLQATLIETPKNLGLSR